MPLGLGLSRTALLQRRPSAGPVEPGERRTNETVAYDFGRLTRSGMGSVSLAEPILGLLKEGAEAPVSWTVGAATAGTDAHWNRTSTARSPVPSGHGVTTDATYVFPVTATFADDSIEECTITITTVADTYTWSEVDNRSTLWTAAGGNEGAGGKTFAVATGAYLVDARRIFGDWRPATPITIKSHDPERRSPARTWELLGCWNIILESLEGGTLDNIHSTIAGRFVFNPSNADSEPCRDIVVNDCRYIGTRETAVNGPNGRPAMLFGAVHGIEVNNFYSEWAYGVLVQNKDGNNADIVVNSVIGRYFGDNGFLCGSSLGAMAITLNDAVFMSPIRFQNSGSHPDGFQSENDAVNAQININHLMVIQADGDALTQGAFISGAQPVANAATVKVNGLIYAGRAYNAIAMGTTLDCSIQNVTAWKTNSGTVPPPGTSYEDADDYVDTGPWIAINDDPELHAGQSVVYRSIVADEFLFHGIPNWVEGGGNHQHYGTRSNPPIDTGFVVSDPMAELDALDYENMTADEIITAVKDIFTPEEGGGYAHGDGTYDGALKPDGTWNDAHDPVIEAEPEPDTYLVSDGTNFFRDPSTLGSGVTSLEWQGVVTLPASRSASFYPFSLGNTNVNVEILANGNFRVSARDSTAASVLGPTFITGANIPDATPTEVSVKVDHVAELVTVTVDGDEYTQAFATSGDGSFAAGGSICFLSRYASGNAIAPAGTQVSDLEVYKNGVLFKAISNDAATANADPWKAGSDFTQGSA